ncbi:MAG: 4-(cytidine 5'-diphospho)-2-C-methyl-D-erythritol kinase [Comamonadaceae bacterium]|nr:4-(cytidine 5'-diphospho)-2-C-methyl-D-erythritol kinase [Comamonadaceae bacterium]
MRVRLDAQRSAMSLRALYDVPAPAKLNLFLHVVGRRADGYHLLQSVFVLIDWADTLHFERRDDGRARAATTSARRCPPTTCACAPRARCRRPAAPRSGADISIDKRVPWGAGMGGGSSDAASTLLALNRLWGLHWPRERLAEIGLRARRRRALLRRRPQRLRRRHRRAADAAGAAAGSATPSSSPPRRIATRDIFAHPRSGPRHRSCYTHGLSRRGSAPVRRLSRAGFGRNDLQPPAEDRCPEVAQAARWLAGTFGNSRMTGSGSAVFARVGTAEPPVATWPGG